MSTLLIPKNLNLGKILKENPPSFKWHIDDFYFLISTIVRMKAINKDYQEMEFVPLSSKILQGQVRDYNKCREYLINAGVIEVNKSYLPDKYSMGYKIASLYSESVSDPIKITKPSLIKQIKEARLEQKKSLKGYEYLTKWFDRSQLKIDASGAEIFLQRMYSREVESGISGALDKYYSRMNSVKLFEIAEYRLSVDPNVKRFWSSLANLKSELRNFITYNGKKLCSIDIKNSQPFFSTLLFNHAFYENSGEHLKLIDLAPHIYDKIQKEIPKIQAELIKYFPTYDRPHGYMLVNLLVKSHESEASNNLELFCTLVDRGKLYEYISDQFFEKTGIRYRVDVPDEKKIIKEAFFYTMYSANNSFWEEKGQMKYLFKELFPTVYKIFSLIKKKDHAFLSIILQLVESEIVIRKTARVLSQNYPTIPLFTIHDNIATYAEENTQKIVYSELKQQCMEIIGLKPSLHVDFWGSEALI